MDVRDARRALAETGERMPGAVGCARRQGFTSQFETRTEKVAGADRVIFEGYASVFERAYEMWDMFGSYNEVMASGSADATLAAAPDVAFLTNHGGVTMARTKSGTLTLDADAIGLHDLASTNPARPDVQTLQLATQDGDIDEQSFAFMIENGQWDPSYTTFRVTQFDINRGDVSGVNFGANPYTSVTARSSEIMAALDRMPAGFTRAAIARLQARMGEVDKPDPVVNLGPKTGRGLTTLGAYLELAPAAA